MKDKSQAVAFRQYLQRCHRPALVDHEGKFYALDIPKLTGSPQHFQAAIATTITQLPDTSTP